MSQVFDRTISIQYLPYPAEQDGKELQAGLFLFPNFIRQLDPATKPAGAGKVVYITGLEPQDVPEDQREDVAKVKKELADYFGEGELDPNNRAFWETKA